MKPKKPGRKLTLNKKTIANLDRIRMGSLYGGNPGDDEYCLTDPEPSCNLETILDPICLSHLLSDCEYCKQTWSYNPCIC
jgi:hypothetical protein